MDERSEADLGVVPEDLTGGEFPPIGTQDAPDGVPTAPELPWRRDS